MVHSKDVGSFDIMVSEGGKEMVDCDTYSFDFTEFINQVLNQTYNMNY